MLTPYYQDDAVTLYHGDALEVLPEIPGESMSFALTDPPYLVNYTGRWNSDWTPIAGDKDSAWLLPAFAEVFRVLQPNSLCCSFYGWPHVEVFMRAWKGVGFRPISQFVFIKNVWGLGYFSRGQHEQAYLLAKGTPTKPACPLSDVFPWDRIVSPEHPTQKPLGPLRAILEAYAPPKGIVLDPFAGSGTTLRAAKDTGRKAIGIEIDEQYCETIARRMSQEVFNFSYQGVTP